MSDERLGEPWHELELCDSTNDELARLAARGASHGAVVVSAAQRAGRGRSGRRWESEAVGNLYGSVLLRPRIEPAAAAPLTLCAGIAVAAAIRSVGVAAMIKWPNDLVIGAQKIGGILTESQSSGASLEHVIVGVGVNIVSSPGGLGAAATSIIEHGGRAVEPAALFRAILAELAPRLAVFADFGWGALRGEFLSLWRDLDARAVASGVRGVLCDVDASGAVVLAAAGRRHRVVAGDVEIDYA